MADQIYNKTITIVGVDTKATTYGTKYTITDQEGVKFSFFTTKKDGENTQVYEQFLNMNLGPNITVQIGGVDESFDLPNGRRGTAHKIVNFRETNERPAPASSQPKTPRSGANFASGKKIEPDWEEIAVGKCQTNFLAAYISAGHSIEDTKLQLTQARRLAELVVYGTQRTQKEESLPVIHVEDEPPIESFVEPPIADEVEGIPF